MIHHTVGYRLIKGDETLVFNSQKEANEFLNLSKDAVGAAYRQNVKCRGYAVERIGLTTHGGSKTRLFKTWDAMKQRCFNPNCNCYKNYGGRGIRVCDEWLKFENFRDWALRNGYSDELTIDRIDVNGNYEPNNCRWATMQEQQNNRRNNRRIMVDGSLMTIAECSREYGISYDAIARRIKKYGYVKPKEGI